MPQPRRSQRDIADEKKAARQEDMDRAIETGKLVVRQMTPEERAQSDARRAAAAARGKNRPKRPARRNVAGTPDAADRPRNASDEK